MKQAPNPSRTLSALSALGRRIREAKVSAYAAASDYFLFMSLAPILMLLVSLVRFLPISQSDVLSTFSAFLPPSVFSVVAPIVRSIFTSGSAQITVSVLLTLFSASSSMRQLMLGLDEVYGTVRKDSLPIFLLRACAYVLVFVDVILLSLVVLVHGAQILDLMLRYLPGARLFRRALTLARYSRYTVVFTILACTFLLMYRWLPAGKRRLSAQWAGALFSAFSWALFSWAFSLYLSVSNRFGAYGYLGTVMVSMMWMYYCLQFFLIGGCINAHLEARRSGEKPDNLRTDS